MLIVHTVLTPIIITATVKSKVLAALLSFIATYGFNYVNFVAMELENPFGTDDNDLPLQHFQSEMNKCLLMLLHTNTDMIATVNHKRCILDFPGLMKSMEPKEEQEVEPTAIPRRLSTFERLQMQEQEEELQMDEEEAEKALKTVEPQPLLAAAPPLPAASPPPESQQEAIDARLAALHPRFSNSLDEFLGTLSTWTSGLEGELSKFHATMAALRAANALRGWEAAVHPSP